MVMVMVSLEGRDPDEKAHDKGKRTKKGKRNKKGKSAVSIRFDGDLLPRMDAQAEVLGLSRAAWVRMTVAQALATP